MRRRRGARFALALALAAFGCAGDEDYNNSDLQLLTSYTAKELCSCVFVMGQSEDFCGRFTKANPNLKTVRVDRANRRVEAQAVLFFGARARWLGPRLGCQLE